MNGHRVAQIDSEPLAHTRDLVVGVVFVRDEQIGDLEPHIAVVTQPFECIQNRCKVGKSETLIESLGERLEIDIDRINIAVKIRTGLLGNIASSDGDSLDTGFATGKGSVMSVFEPDYRIIVGKGD